MIANQREYATWSTHAKDVANNEAVVFTGETNAAHPEGILSLFRGVYRGQQYWPWRVIVRRQGRYLGHEAAGAAGEIKIPGRIDVADFVVVSRQRRQGSLVPLGRRPETLDLRTSRSDELLELQQEVHHLKSGSRTRRHDHTGGQLIAGGVAAPGGRGDACPVAELLVGRTAV